MRNISCYISICLRHMGIIYTGRVVYRRILKYLCTVIRGNMDENIYESRRYISPFYLHLSPRSVSLASIFLRLARRGHSTVFRETGIASYFPEGCWVNSRSENRDHGACKSKCTSAIFEVRGVADGDADRR